MSRAVGKAVTPMQVNVTDERTKEDIVADVLKTLEELDAAGPGDNGTVQ